MTEINKLPPAYMELVRVADGDLPRLGKVTDTSIFNNIGSFSSASLFSTEIFGPVGSEQRNRTFGYIDLNIELLHPLLYRTVISLKSFYSQILEGKTYAIFNEKTGEFEKSVAEGSSTGYSFFMSHLEELKFEKNQSDSRNFKIELFNKAVKEGTVRMRYLLVMPAGMRDYTVNESGQPQEDEVNSFYRKALAQSSVIDPAIAKRNPAVYDGATVGIQKTLLSLYEYLESLLDGKHKLILGKWVSRKIFNSTRNVVSSYIEKTTKIDDPRRAKFNEAVVGLHQYARASAPKSLYEIKNKYVRQIFVENSNIVNLVNAKTLKREEVISSHITKDYDRWTSSDGLEKVIASMDNYDLRDLPITLNKGKHFLALIYRDERYFKIFYDIDELPEGYSKDKVTPVTLTEFIYASIHHMDAKYPGLVTRYPITGYGSVYPVFVRVNTTTENHTLEELDENWHPTGSIANSFPIPGKEYLNTITVHHSHLAALGGDFDGDTLSLTMLLSDESISEITQSLNKKEYYISSSGDFTFSNNTDILDVVLKSMT